MSEYTASKGIRIAPISCSNKEDWLLLYGAYAKQSKVFQTDEMRERAWAWMMDPACECKAIVALNGPGRVVGFAHYRSFLCPIQATRSGYLDDLFVEPASRGRQIGEALLEALADEGRKCGWSVVRWTAASVDTGDQTIYDRVARLTTLRTYDMPLAWHVGDKYALVYEAPWALRP